MLNQVITFITANYIPQFMFIGLVGKPSAGKSTFFRALTLANIETANYPFTTIKPNHGVGHVKIKDIAREFN